eukprot:PITA_15883
MDITLRAVGSDQPETSAEHQSELNVTAMHENMCFECDMCFDDVNVTAMHENMFCHHRYCFRCLTLYVKAMIAQSSNVPICPHRMCISKLTIHDCEKFLPSKWLEILIKRSEEEKIADSEKVYCPYPDCSFLMASSELNKCGQVPSPFSSSSHSSLTIKATKCQKCCRLFCIECKVPWHTDMSCEEYAPQLGAASGELNLLAENNKWKRCPNCKHMIERTGGCRHIICRCNHVFCYQCGRIPWKGNCDCIWK